MTVTLIPGQLAEETGVGTESRNVEPEHAKADTQQLAALLAQAYVALSLFP
ncbi:MAG TPA: hypothetical protein VG795_12700 [Acidimicrobiia bacterium]|nr:hypothetical protein [Acidimicrobiia bacterium]